jgi:Ca2+-binding EF-hand superfamily protein
VFNDTQKIQNAFDLLDKDGNGYIDERELAEIIGMSQGFDSRLMRKLIQDVDDNRDNKIDFNEFKRMISNISSQ